MAFHPIVRDCISIYSLDLSDAHLLLTFWEIRDYVNCAHRDRSCFVKGRCCIGYCHEVLELLTTEPSVREMRQVISVMRKRLKRKHEVWVTLRNAVPSLGDLYTKEFEAVTTMRNYLNIFAINHMLAHCVRKEEDGYSYVDDSLTYIHAFFKPVGPDVKNYEIQMAIGPYVINFYDIVGDDFDIGMRMDSEWRRQVREVLSAYNAEHPFCDITGNRVRRRWVVHFPLWMHELLRPIEARTAMMRRLDVDVKLIINRKTELGERIIHQRIGIREKNGFEGFLHTVRHVCGADTFKCAFRYSTQTLAGFGIPMMLVRRAFHMNDWMFQIGEYYGSHHDCAGCFLTGSYGTAIDMRTSEYSGANMIRRCHPVQHGRDSNIDHLVMQLPQRQTLIVQGNHWFTVYAESCFDELLLVAGVIHRHFRGGEMNNITCRRNMMILIAHAYTHWDPTADDTVFAFRLCAYLYLDIFVASIRETVAWGDFGEFLKVMTGSGAVGETEVLNYHQAVMKLCVTNVCSRNHEVTMGRADDELGVCQEMILPTNPFDIPSVRD